MGWVVDWRDHRTCYWQTLGFSQALVCLISMMTLDSGDFAELGGFQKIKRYLWVLKTKTPPVYVGLDFQSFLFLRFCAPGQRYPTESIIILIISSPNQRSQISEKSVPCLV